MDTKSELPMNFGFYTIELFGQMTLPVFIKICNGEIFYLVTAIKAHYQFWGRIKFTFGPQGVREDIKIHGLLEAQHFAKENRVYPPTITFHAELD